MATLGPHGQVHKKLYLPLVHSTDCGCLHPTVVAPPEFSLRRVAELLLEDGHDPIDAPDEESRESSLLVSSRRRGNAPTWRHMVPSSRSSVYGIIA